MKATPPLLAVFVAMGLAFLPGRSAGAAETTAAPARVNLGPALLLHASFDRGLNADFAVGDPILYTATNGNLSQARPGLPDGSLVVLAKGEGRGGDALRFTKKMRPVVFFHGLRNLNYSTNNWSGACSFWLRLDPDKDLEPGYCDPLQFVAQGWDEGNMFVEFSKDHTPRHFRYAMMPVKSSWNPSNRGWEDFPDQERLMVPVRQPTFSRERWTHVCFTFGNVNSGRKDGWGSLYLDGKFQGRFEGWLAPFRWDEAKSAVTLGLSYVGLLDELAIFNRPLTESEIRGIAEAPSGLGSLLK